MEDIRIVYKSKNIVIVAKPAGMPTQPDPSGDVDAMTRTAAQLSSEGNALYLINRLDRVVGGLIIFARNKRYAASLSEMVSGEGIVKEYLAVVSGAPERCRYVDYLYKDARISKAFLVDRKRAGVKEAVLDLAPIASVGDASGVLTLVKVRLHTGRYHQIRCQLSGRGNPIVGDGKYGSRDKGAAYPALFASRLSFSVLGESVDVRLYPDISEYPWCKFDLKTEESVSYD